MPRFRRLLTALVCVALALAAAPSSPGAAQDAKPGGDAAPKEDPDALRKLPDDEKAKRLDAWKKEYDDLSRNQDLAQVRRRRLLTRWAGDLRYAPAAKFLKTVFNDDRSLSNQVEALVAIGKTGDFETIESAVKRSLATTKKTPVFSASLWRMFAVVEDPKSRDWLPGRLAGEDDPVVLASLAEAVGETGVAIAMPDLLKVLDRSKDPAVRFEVLRALGRCGRSAALPKILPFLTDPDPRIRMAAAEGLGFAGDPSVIPDLRKLLVRTEEAIVAETATEAIVRLGTRDAVEPLIDALKIGRLRARQKARDGLRAIAKGEFGQEKDYHVDPNAWGVWWRKAKSGLAPDDPAFRDSDTTTYFNFPIRSDRVLFILDVSGSMDWPDAPKDSGIRPSDWKERRIDIAHRELFAVLKKLAEQNRGRVGKRKSTDTSDIPWAPSDDGTEPPTLFNVATFSGAVTPWGKSAVLANDENVAAAIEWIRKQLPRGGTATYDALDHGLAQEDIDTIYFLSDGVPSAGRYEERETILGEVRKRNRFRRVTIHTIALIIGLSPIESARKYEDPDDMAELMGRIATENQGRFSNQSRP